MKRQGNKGLITLILLTIAVCLTRLGKMPLMGTDEGMYGSASFNMLASGDYTIPRLGGLPFYDKPPLCYWLQAQSMKVFGVNEFALRLPSAVCFCLLVWLVTWAGAKIFDRRRGIFAGFITATSVLVAALGRMCLTDGPLTLAISACLLWFILAHTGKIGKACYILSSAALGCAVMIKGPAAAVLVFLTIGVYLALKREKPDRAYLLSLLLAVAAALPWFLLANARTGGDFGREFFLHQNVARALGKDFAHNYPIWSYIPVLLVGMLPWSLYIPVSFRDLRVIPAKLFLVLWAAVIFAVFTAIPSKLPGYIVPMIPACALLIGGSWRRTDKAFALPCLFAAALIFGIIFFVLPRMSEKQWEPMKEVAAVVKSVNPGDLSVYGYKLSPPRPELEFYTGYPLIEVRKDEDFSIKEDCIVIYQTTRKDELSSSLADVGEVGDIVIAVRRK